MIPQVTQPLDIHMYIDMWIPTFSVQINIHLYNYNFTEILSISVFYFLLCKIVESDLFRKKYGIKCFCTNHRSITHLNILFYIYQYYINKE